MFDILFDILKCVRNIQKKEISKQTNAFFHRTADNQKSLMPTTSQHFNKNYKKYFCKLLLKVHLISPGGEPFLFKKTVFN